LPVEAAKLDGDEENLGTRIPTSECGGPGKSCSASRASQAPDGRSEDIRSQTEPVDEIGVQTGSSQAGGRDQDDVVDVDLRMSVRIFVLTMLICVVDVDNVLSSKCKSTGDVFSSNSGGAWQLSTAPLWGP
jgi:hypothetical protein